MKIRLDSWLKSGGRAAGHNHILKGSVASPTKCGEAGMKGGHAAAVRGGIERRSLPPLACSDKSCYELHRLLNESLVCVAEKVYTGTW